MRIVVNGTDRELQDAESVSDLLESIGLGSKACAVEVNRRLVRKADHPDHRLADGDIVEVVTLVGGG